MHATEKLARVLDLFREWDTDGSGTVSKREFRRAIASLSYEAGKEEVRRIYCVTRILREAYITSARAPKSGWWVGHSNVLRTPKPSD